VNAALAEDEKIRNTAWIAAKLVVLGESYLAQGKTAQAVASARRVITLMGREPISVLAAQILVQAGVDAEAKGLALELSRQLQPESRAYGKIIQGDIALRQGGAHTIEAVEAFVAAQKLADLWMARFGLGTAYVAAEHYAEAVQALEASQKRRGEATAIFLDDLPTVRYLAPVSYWLARAQDGLGLKPAAAENYKKYLALRAAAVGGRRTESNAQIDSVQRKGAVSRPFRNPRAPFRLQKIGVGGVVLMNLTTPLVTRLKSALQV
jgi:tetratricopeptide (TPR) repeat protein